MAGTNKISSCVQFDRTGIILKRPVLLLKTRTGEFIGKIPYTDLKFSFVGVGMDELSFKVHKYNNKKKCEFWDRLTELAIIDYVGYGQFEAAFAVNDSDETIKTCTAVSLETELGQRMLREFHVNDDEAFLSEDFSPTYLYNENDTEHSLFHRVLADKGQHWKFNHIPALLNAGGHVYDPSAFQRTYTADNVSIYDFLTGEVAEESGCVFTFDTYKREINCYNLKECVYDKNTNKAVENVDYTGGLYYYKDGTRVDGHTAGNYGYCDGIGSDTNVFVTKNKLANELQLQYDRDSIKNCFYVTGGDDEINNWIGAATGTGTNYIYMFDDFQYGDMPDELSGTIQNYDTYLKHMLEVYHGETDKYTADESGYYNLFPRYCEALDNYYYLRDNMFPDISLKDTTAEEQVREIISHFSDSRNRVIVKTAYSTESFAGITNTVESMIKVKCDSRYTVTLLSDENSYPEKSYPRISNGIDDDNTTCTWTGRIKLVRDTDEKDCCTSGDFTVCITKIPYNDYGTNDAWCKQRFDIAVAKMSIADLDLSHYTTPDALQIFFDQYNLESLKNFYEGFKNCIQELDSLYSGNPRSDTYESMKKTYQMRCDACKMIYGKRENEVNNALSEAEYLKDKIQEFQKTVNMKEYFLKKANGELLWEYLQCYIREDEYNNPNYFADGLASDADLLKKAKELVDAAKEELKNACARQYTVSGNLNNLFALNELSALYDHFNLFNYIRCRIDDRVYKLRIIQVDFDENSPQDLSVTFSENIESVTGVTDDTKSILSQAASIATSYSSTARQAKQGSDALGTVTNLKNEGLSSADYVINNDESEVVIDNLGILCRSVSDIDVFDEHQLRITGSTIVYTDSAWTDLPRMAIGYTKLDDKWLYGVVCDALVGKLIAGEELVISNQNSNVKIDGNGLSMENGRIALTNNINTVIIDPGADDEHLFVIKKNAGGKEIFYVDKNGNAHFDGVVNVKGSEVEGTITAKSGFIGNWKIEDGNLTNYKLAHIQAGNNNNHIKIWNGTVMSSFLNSDGIYNRAYFQNGTLQCGKTNLFDETISTSTYRSIITSDVIQLCDKNGNVWTDINSNYDYEDKRHIMLGSASSPAEDIYLNGTNVYLNGQALTSNDMQLVVTSTAVTDGDGNHTIKLGWDGSALYAFVDNTNVTSGGIASKNDLSTTHIKPITGTAGNITFAGALNADGSIADDRYIAISRFYWDKHIGSSDFRVKRDITPINSIKDIYLGFKPKYYRFKENTQINAEKLHSGLLAQQVMSNFKRHGYDIADFDIIEEHENRQAMDEGMYTDNGKFLRINYDNLHAYHIAFGQEIHKEFTEEINALKHENYEYKQEIASLKQEINDLKEAVRQLQGQN